MIYKEKLAGGGDSLDYTHIVHVATISAKRSYGYTRYFKDDPAGDITPSNRFKCFVYDGVYEFELSKLSTGGLIADGLKDLVWEDLLFYLGRQDTNIVYCSRDYSDGDYDPETGQVYLPIELFDINDVGKDIPIWLSNTPPPLVRRQWSFRGRR